MIKKCSEFGIGFGGGQCIRGRTTLPFFGPFAFRHVDARSDKPEKLLPFAEKRRRGIDVPVIISIVALEPILQPECLTPAVRFEEQLGARPPVIRMDCLQPSESQARPGSLSGKLVPRFAEEGAGSVLIRHPHHDRRMVRHATKPLLALTDRLGCVTTDERHVHMGIHPCQQFSRSERLDEIVVRPLLQTLHLRFLSGSGGEHNDRDRFAVGIGPHFAQQTKSIQIRHHHIGHDQVRSLPPNGLQGSFTVRDRFDLIPFSQQAGDIVADIGIVVGDEDAGRAGLPFRSLSQSRLRRLLRRRFKVVTKTILTLRQPSQGFFDKGPSTQRRRDSVSIQTDTI